MFVLLKLWDFTRYACLFLLTPLKTTTRIITFIFIVLSTSLQACKFIVWISLNIISIADDTLNRYYFYEGQKRHKNQQNKCWHTYFTALIIVVAVFTALTFAVFAALLKTMLAACWATIHAKLAALFLAVLATLFKAILATLLKALGTTLLEVHLSELSIKLIYYYNYTHYP